MNDEEYFRVVNFTDSLAVSVTPAETWEEVIKDVGLGLDIDFDASDKEAIFFDALQVFDPAGAVNGRVPADDYHKGKWNELCSRFETSLHEATANYPMLRRFEAEYEDVFFKADEVATLRQECERVRARTENSNARNSLDKLIQACDAAIEAGQSLFFASD